MNPSLTTITVPFWGAVFGAVAVIAAALIAGFFALKGTRVTAQAAGPNASLAALITNAPALLDRAQDLLNANAKLQDDIRAQKDTIQDLTDRIVDLEKTVKGLSDAVGDHDGERLVWERERQDWDLERCGLENEVVECRHQIELRDAEIARLSERVEHLTILGETSARAQEYAEGANAQANRTIQALTTSPNPTTTSPNPTINPPPPDC